MKKKLLCLFLAMLLLTGCGRTQPLPAHWEADWTVVCPVLAVEPYEGFTLHESNDALYLSGIYYATWVTGKARPHTNEAGEQAQIFDAQIYVIAQEFRNPDSAKSGISQWITREKTTFDAGDEKTVNCAGRDFTVFSVQGGTQGNPYRRGAAAFVLWDNWAICVELLGTQDYDGAMEQMLEAFLDGFHFSE